MTDISIPSPSLRKPRQDAVIDLLLTRRSLVALRMTEPGPTEAELSLILRCAMRVPDHGKLAPWRIQVIAGQRRAELGEHWARIYAQNNPHATPEQLAFERQRPLRAPVLLAVSTRIESDRIPRWEQVLSGAAVCQNALIAANALGYYTQWLTEWPAYDAEAKALLGLQMQDEILGYLYIGSASEVPAERPRPQPEDIVSWW